MVVLRHERLTQADLVSRLERHATGSAAAIKQSMTLDLATAFYQEREAEGPLQAAFDASDTKGVLLNFVCGLSPE